jgi:hypothetical protein
MAEPVSAVARLREGRNWNRARLILAPHMVQSRTGCRFWQPQAPPTKRIGPDFTTIQVLERMQNAAWNP